MKFNTSYLSGACFGAVLLCLLFVSGVAVAQDTPTDEEAAAASALPQRDDAHPLYWAEMRDIYTVQKRAFQKEGRFAVSLYGGIIPNNIFERYYPVGLRLNYFILENLGVELAGSYAFKKDTDLRDTITDPTGVSAQDVLIGDTQLSHTNFGVTWSPVYGKLAWFDSGLFYLDMYVFAGAGLVVAQTIRESNAEPDTAFKPEGVLGGGLAIYAGQHVGLRLDFRQFIFQKVTNGVAKPSEVSLGLSWFF